MVVPDSSMELLVMKWLQERGYLGTLAALELESDTYLHECGSQVKLIKGMCIEGNFDGLTRLVRRIFSEPHQSLYIFSIRKHELLERLSSTKTKQDIYHYMEMLMDSEDILGSEYLGQFETAVKMPDPLRHDLFNGWSKLGGRYEIFESMLPLLSKLFPDQPSSYKLNPNCSVSNPLDLIIGRFRDNNPVEFQSFFCTAGSRASSHFTTPLGTPTVEPASVIETPRKQTTDIKRNVNFEIFKRYKDPSNQPIRVAQFSHDGRVAIGTNSSSLLISDLVDRTTEFNFQRTFRKIHAGSVYTIAWDPEHANWIATGSNDQTIKFIRFDTDSGTRINVNSGTVRSIVATSSSTIFAGCSGDTLLRRFDIERHDVLVANWSCPMSKPNGSTTYINSLSIDVKDYKSQLVLVSLSNGIASLIDPRTSGAIWQVSGCSSPAVGKLYGEKILVARESGTVTMYDKRSNSSPVWEYDVRTTCRSVDLTCELVAVAGFDGTIRLLKTSDGSISHELSGGHADRIVHVSWSPDSYLVSCGTDSQTVLWRRDSAPNR